MVEKRKCALSVISNRDANKAMFVNEWVSIIIMKRNNEKKKARSWLNSHILIHRTWSLALIFVIDHYCNFKYNKYNVQSLLPSLYVY